MSRVVSIAVKEVVPTRATIEEALNILSKHYTVDRPAKDTAIVGGLVTVEVRNGGVRISYNQNYGKSRDVAKMVKDALITASTVRALREMNMSVNVRKTERGFDIEAWR